MAPTALQNGCLIRGRSLAEQLKARWGAALKVKAMSGGVAVMEKARRAMRDATGWLGVALLAWTKHRTQPRRDTQQGGDADCTRVSVTAGD